MREAGLRSSSGFQREVELQHDCGLTAPETTQGANVDWQANTLYRDAQTRLHAQVLSDLEGRSAARFGAETSGEVLLYTAQDQIGRRHLLYAGGVTGARGMTGANAGARALVQTYRQQQEELGRPVFGCGLLALGGKAKIDLAVRESSADAGREGAQ